MLNIDPAQIKTPAGYHVVVTTDGIAIVADVPVQSVMATAASWLVDRSAETSTHAGVAGGMALTPLIIQTVTSALAGDYPAAIMSGVPAVIGFAGALAAIITPTPKGLTDEQIHAAVSRMSHDQLISLLGQSTETSVLPASQSLV